MLILIFSILLFILSIVFIYIGNGDWDKEWLLYFGIGLIIIMIMPLIIEFTMLISKPIEYKNFKIEYDVVKETITSSEDIRDTNYTQKLIEINTKIKTNREYKDSIWCGIFFNKKIADLELLRSRKENKMQLSIKIDADIYDLLKKIKDRDDVPMSASLRRAVEKYAQEKGVK